MKYLRRAHTLYEAYWVNNQDIADPDLVATLIGREAVERAGIQEVKDALFQSTDEAVKRGAFGAPTFFVKDEMFFWTRPSSPAREPFDW